MDNNYHINKYGKSIANISIKDYNLNIKLTKIMLYDLKANIEEMKNSARFRRIF